MSNIRKSTDGRKRTRTMEYIDSQVDINDDDNSQNRTIHIGQHIHVQFDQQQTTRSTIDKYSKRNSEQSVLSRQISDISLNQSNKTITEFKGRDQIRRIMKNNSKSIMEFKNTKLIQEMFGKQQDTSKPISDFAFKYGLTDNNTRKVKNQPTSNIISNMTQQLENLKANLNKRQFIDPTSSLLRIVRIESVCNQILCYCQYIDDREDLVLFLDRNHSQTQSLEINDRIRISDQSRYNMNIPDIGSISMGIIDIEKACENKSEIDRTNAELVHTYDFNCLCNQCNPKTDFEQVLSPTFDLLSTFSSRQSSNDNIVYDSFTVALMSKRIFDLRASIIIFNSDRIHHHYVFIVRDIIGNCLEIILNDLNGLQIEIQTKIYIFHQIEFIERIQMPKEVNRWPHENYLPPRKLFSFRSIANRVSLL